MESKIYLLVLFCFFVYFVYLCVKNDNLIRENGELKKENENLRFAVSQFGCIGDEVVKC